MRQSWHDLLFAHWRVSYDHLRQLVPAAFELQTFDGDAWVAVTPFHLTDVAPRGVPALPWISAFNEINVRTYVSADNFPGVYFFSLDANNALAVTGASTVFHLPYHNAAIELAIDEEGVRFQSERQKEAPAKFRARYAPAGAPFASAPGTLEHFLTERYCLYTIDSSGDPYRVRIDHAPWQLQTATAEIFENSMADAAGIRLGEADPLFHFAGSMPNVLTWPPERVG